MGSIYWHNKVCISHKQREQFHTFMGSVAIFILLCFLYLSPCLISAESTVVYGDVFSKEKRDGYSKTGCYNLRCPGFVPASGAALFPGQAVAPPSTYDGDDRYITISLHTDPNTGDWVVYRDDLDTPSFLGYFPRDLCPELIGSAPRVAWSGFVSYPKDERGPPMGSGHFPDEGHKKAAYFEKMRIFNSKGNAQDPVVSNLEWIATRQDCYKVSSIYVEGKGSCMFYYGGPGGCRD